MLIDTTTQRFTSGPQPEADICVLHTTEGNSWPGYSGGGEAPHSTIWPLPRVGIQVREHIPTSCYAKALMNLPAGVETNRRGALQYELVGTCDPTSRGKAGWYYWPDADDAVLAALAGYLRPILARYLIPHVAPAFKAYPASYGKANGIRMSYSTWNAFNGIVGHEHVPENLHGDPGLFPIAKLIAHLKGATAPKEIDMPLTDADATLVMRKVLSAKLGHSETTVAQALQATTALHNADIAAIAAAVVAALTARKALS